MKKLEKRLRMQKKWKCKWILILIVPALVIITLGIAFLIYTGQYYHADESAYSALKSDKTVAVVKTEYGYFFDGPSETDAIIFYPGAKVEETAYAPLLHSLAEQGVDACLVEMPFHLAFFGINKADRVMEQYDYDHWYIGGHSLGGAMAASYASGHGSQLAGVVMLAAYPAKALDDNTSAVIIYGSEDGVLNMTRLNEADKYLPEDSKKYVIEGGNHAQFGNYGIQRGDGNAAISPEVQQQRTVELIIRGEDL